MKPRKFINSQLIIYLLLIAVIISIAYSVKGDKPENKPFKKIDVEKDLGSLRFEMKLNNRYYYSDARDNSVYLNIDLISANTEHRVRRAPLNLSIVIDKSGSMDERNKLNYVKEAVNYVIDELDGEDYLSVITYDDEVDVLQSTSPVKGKYLLKDKVSGLKAGGYTNLSGGMLEGYEQVERYFKRGYVNRVLLLSDGIANKGITDVRRLEDIVMDKNKREGVVLSTFGVGYDFNEDLMGSIAEYGRGNYYYIKSPESIPQIFASELNSLRYLAAQNARLRVKIPYGLELEKVYGYPYDIEGNEVVVDFKDVFSNEEKTLLLKFRPSYILKNDVSFHAVLEYDDADNGFSYTRAEEYSDLKHTNIKSEYESGFNKEVQKDITMFEANELMEEALYDADKGDYENAVEKVKRGKDLVNSQGEDIKSSEEVERQYENMKKYEGELNSAPTMSTEEKSVMQKENKYNNYKVKKKKK